MSSGSDLTEAQLRLILEGVQDHAISMLDAEGAIVTWNATAERIKGYRLDEVRGRHFRLLFTAEDREAKLPERELAVARETGNFLGEGDRLRKDGSTFRASVSVSSLYDSAGVLRGFVKVTHDISEQVRRREAEERSRRRMTKLHELMAALSDAATLADVARVIVNEGTGAVDGTSGALWLADPDRTLRLASQRSVPDDFIAHWSIMTPDAETPAQQVARTRRPLWIETVSDFERASPVIASRAKAEERVKAYVALPVVAHDRVLGVLCYGYDGPHAFAEEDRPMIEATASHCAQALDRARLLDLERRQNQRLRLLLELGTQFAASLDYETTLANLARAMVPDVADWCSVDLVGEDGKPKLVAVAHVDPEKVELARDLRKRFPARPSDAFFRVVQSGEPALVPVVTDAMLVAGTIDADHLRIVRQLDVSSVMVVPLTARGRTFGTISFVSTAGSRRYDDDDMSFALAVATRAALAVDNANLYREAQSAAQQASEASRMKDEFLATVSHELRTPLNAVLGWARMVRAGTLDAGRRERALDAIERNAVAQTQLIDDLLDVSRIITGKLRLDVQTIDLMKVIEAGIESVRPAIDAKEIRLQPVLDPGAHAILGDSARLQQVVWNLLSNAIKFTPRQGRIQIGLQCVNSHVELSVADDGEGISADFLPYVFDRFRQADGGFTRARGGLGVGLAIARSVVELHGGAIEAHSEGLGHGATFIVRLPRAPVRYRAPDSSRHHPSSPEALVFERPQELRGLKVLVVEDEADARELLVEILEQCEAEVRQSGSMSEALDTLSKWRPDVLLSDIGMPGGDGYEVIRAVRSLPAEKGGNVPAAALTAYARAADRRRALLSGYQMHVPKPVEPAELVAVVANLARIGRAMR